MIVCGAVLPVLAALGGTLDLHWLTVSKDVQLSLLSATIAILTGLLAHFRWDVGWRGQTEALFGLLAIRAEWEGAVAAAKTLHGDSTAEQLTVAFEKLRNQTFEIVHAEMGEFFKIQQTPTVPTPQK